MLSYQHGYHAGNYADVIKHLTLTHIIQYMVSKEKPIFYLDTHAGKGLYHLQDKQALKTGEAAQGIELLWEQRKQLPKAFEPYLHPMIELNHGPTLRYYPGSPYLAVHCLRQQDRLFFSELHPREFEELQQMPCSGKRVFINHGNGLDQLKALLPPPERRGLIFIDPSYEVKTEYREIPKALKQAYQRFETGVYCVWYPIVDQRLHEQLLKGLANIGAEHNLRIEFKLTNAVNPGMTGCGLWIINPPYVLRANLKPALDALCRIFNPGISSFLVD